MSGGVPVVRGEDRIRSIEDQGALRSLAVELGDEERIGLDTEFVGERSFVPQLELIQVSTPGRTVLIDCRKVGSLDPFFAVLLDPRIEKVLHAGQQDLELVRRLTGRTPSPIVDTQIAAAMAGYGAQPGYADLLERVLRVTVEKSETLTDWSRRPLTPEQLAYAADDVRYLLPLYDFLRQRLTALGRWEWVLEECGRLERSAGNVSLEPEEAYLRVKGRGSLRSRGLVVLSELARWRDEVARDQNRPRSSVARDETLVEVARKAPTTVRSLRGLRAVRSREIDRRAEEVVGRIVRALETPREQWPKPMVANGATPSPGVVELLQAVLRLRADEASIAPSLIATQADLQRLVKRHRLDDLAELPIARGWRYEIAGRDLLAVLEGRATVMHDPEHARLRVRVTEADEGSVSHGG